MHCPFAALRRGFEPALWQQVSERQTFNAIWQMSCDLTGESGSVSAGDRPRLGKLFRMHEAIASFPQLNQAGHMRGD
ncbi:hypothetical protein V7S43_014698 [Phytophthora oleae]|uniref:Uncharacterized protein n=1 Tax=Phytophthora oleae TaxID=2107226 RepID=A0ABD3F156_9STRA